MQNQENRDKPEASTKKCNKGEATNPLYKRRTTSIALGLVSSLVIAGIGFELMNSSESGQLITANPNITSYKQLNFSDDTEIALADGANSLAEDVNLIQTLTRQKTQQAQKIEFLKNELQQTQARLTQLKNDILMRGGKKEQRYQEIVANLESELENAEKQNEQLRNEIMNRDRLVENKISEIEKLKRIFNKNQNNLKATIHNISVQFTEEKLKNEQLLEDIKSQFSIYQDDFAQTENIEELIFKVKNRISELENQVQKSQAGAERTILSSDNSTNPHNLKAIDTFEEKAKTEPNFQDAYNRLELELKKAEERAASLESQLKLSESDKPNPPFDRSKLFPQDLVDEHSNLKAKIEILVQKLASAKKEISAVQQSYETALKNKEEHIQALSDTVITLHNQANTIKNFNQLEASDREKRLYKIHLEQAEQIQNLQEELSKSREVVAKFNDKATPFNERFYQDRVKVLELAYNEQEKKLQKIQALENKNQNLERQLEKNEAYLQSIQNQLGRENVTKEKESTIHDLEMHIALMSDIDNTKLSINQKNEKSLALIVQELNKELDNEKERRISSEKEVASLKERMVGNQNAYYDADLNLIFDQEEEMRLELEAITKKYNEEKGKTIELEKRIQAVSKWANTLQNELAAYEAAKEVEEGSASNSIGNINPIKLKAKIAYLKTRLSQEKSKQANTDEQLQELLVTFEEVKKRNDLLERTVHEAGLKIF